MPKTVTESNSNLVLVCSFCQTTLKSKKCCVSLPECFPPPDPTFSRMRLVEPAAPLLRELSNGSLVPEGLQYVKFQAIPGIDCSLRYCKENTFKLLLKK